MESISKTQARKLAISASLHVTSSSSGKEISLRTVQHLGYVQIDTISVIERAHHHIFWTRNAKYESDHLDQLLARDRAVFEHWAHAVAYLPIEDYRYYLPKMEAYKKPTGEWQKERLKTAKPLFKGILKRIREEGPLGSKDFEHVKRKSPGWWEWKPAKRALEILYLQGDLMVSERKNFHRLYDLTERVLPQSVDTKVPSPRECAVHQIKRALQSMGLAREVEIANYLKVCDRAELKKALRELLESGEIIELAVRGIPSENFYTFPGQLETLGKIRTPKKVRLLSPFDNMVIQRDRMKLLFDFDYTIECYVPQPKRKFGYFVCPVLWGNELVARIDMKADRKKRTLLVQSLHYEDSLKNRISFDDALDKALLEFAGFNSCDQVIPQSGLRVIKV
jgi:uncharacterized protein